MKVAINRDSICMADDIESHASLLEFEDGLSVESVVGAIYDSRYLAYSSSVSWVVVSSDAFALIEQNGATEYYFKSPRSLRSDGSWPRLDELNWADGALNLYFKAYHDLNQSTINAITSG